MSAAIMRWVALGNVMVTCSTNGDVPNDVWDSFCEDMKKKKITKSLALSLGEASLTSVQRKSAADIAKAQGIRSAVVTDARLVRGIVTALSWFGIAIKGFSFQEFQDAIKFLEIAPALEDRVKSAALDLRSQVEQERAGRLK